MAGADYIKCDSCGERLVYAPNICIDTVHCNKCYNKLLKRIDKLSLILKKFAPNRKVKHL